MVRIIDNRCTGKTSRLMLLAKEHNALFVCARPNHMQEKAEAYGIQGIHFVSYEDFLRLNYDTDEQTVVVDELDELLKRMVHPLSLLGYSISIED